jgi:CYTH domain-containing protein
MAIEIERKFLVASDKWRSRVTETWAIKQGYLLTKSNVTVRIRTMITPVATYNILTIKGPSKGISRPEFELPMRQEDALEMMNSLCGKRIVEKLRHMVPCPSCDLTWEIDEFTGRHQGLVLAEIELERPKQYVRLPKWIGREVSKNPKYSSRSLAEHGLRNIKKDMEL